jgi:hypothetical protein
MEWGTGAVWMIQTLSTPNLTPAGYVVYKSSDENLDSANTVIPYRGPCSFSSRGLLRLGREYYDSLMEEETYYPRGVYLL